MSRNYSRVISSAGMRVVDELLGRPPQTISELLQRVGVTRTAVTEQLDDLVKAGWVLREREHLGARGRPKFRYSLTPEAVAALYPAGSPSIIVPIIWEVLKELGGEEFFETALQRISEKVAKTYESRVVGPTVRDRFVQSMESMAPYGERFECREGKDGALEVIRYACEVCSINDKNSTLCRMHMKVLDQTVVGGRVTCVQNRMLGFPYCIFHLEEDV